MLERVSATAAPATPIPIFFFGRGVSGSVRQRSADATNITATSPNSTSYPPMRMTTGARRMNPRRNAPLNVKVKSEFATIRSRRRTMDGSVADSAGMKNVVIAATRKFTM